MRGALGLIGLMLGAWLIEFGAIFFVFKAQGSYLTLDQHYEVYCEKPPSKHTINVPLIYISFRVISAMRADVTSRPTLGLRVNCWTFSSVQPQPLSLDGSPRM